MAAVRAVSLGGYTTRLMTRLPAVAPFIKPAQCHLRVRTTIPAPLARWMSDGPPNIHGDLSPNDVSSKAMKRRLAARHAAEVRVAARPLWSATWPAPCPRLTHCSPSPPLVQRRAEAEVAAATPPPLPSPPADPWTAALQQYTSPAPATTVPPPAPPAPAGGYFAQQQQQPLPPLTESLKHYFVAGIAIALAFTVVRVLFGG